MEDHSDRHSGWRELNRIVYRMMNSPFLLAILFCLPQFAGAQAQSKPAPTRQQIVAAARSIIAKARYATFATLGGKGEPRARIVDPFAPDSDFVVWVATNPQTRKVTEIKRDSRVVILWFEQGNPGYVSLSGRATIVTDRAAKAAHWKPEWKEIYPKGNLSDEYLLIRIKPTHMEVVSYQAGLVGDPKRWRPAMIDF